MSALDELWPLVRGIPEGRCSSYGDLGQALRNPVSGLLIGRWMSNCPNDIPWWRVVGADGTLPVWKKDPTLEVIQHDKLAEEGVDFLIDGRVDMEKFRYIP